MSLARFLATGVAPAAGTLPVRSWWSSSQNFFSPVGGSKCVSRVFSGPNGKQSERRRYSSSQAHMQAEGEGGDPDKEDDVVSKLRPHLYIHLARSRFAENATDDYRRGWETEANINSTLRSIVQESGGQLSTKRALQKAIDRLNEERDSGAEYVVPAQQVKQTKRVPVTLHQVMAEQQSSTTLTEEQRKALFEEQLSLETQTLEEAVDKYRQLSYDLVKGGRGSSMKPAERLMLSWFTPMAEALEKLQYEITNEGRMPMYGAFIMHLRPSELTCICLHEVIAMLMANPGGINYTKIAKNIGAAVEAETNLKMLRGNKVQWRNLTRNVKVNAIKPWMINRMAKQIEQGKWTDVALVRVGDLLLDVLLETAKVPSTWADGVKASKIDAENDTGPKMKPTSVKAFTSELATQGFKQQRFIFCSNRVFQVLDSNQEAAESLFTTHKVMVCEPRPWTRPDIGGYWTLKTQIMRTRSGQHLQMLNYAKMDKVYESLNFLGSIPWKIDARVLDVVERLWEDGGGIANLPSLKDPIVPNPPKNKKKTKEEADARRKWKRQVKNATKIKTELHSLRCDTNLKLGVASKFKGRRIYFPCNIDFRGRVYPLPPHLNHLGADLSRSLLRFYEGKPLGANGFKWLKVHLANVSGKDKLPFEERVKWSEEHMEHVLAVHADPSSEAGKWWLTAEEPLQCLATCFEIGDAIQSGDIEGFVSHLPVHMDGSCNGLQHYGALGRDKAGGAAVNLSPHETPQDVYAGVLNVVNLKVEDDAKEGHELAVLLQGKITRKVIKQTVMTTVYGVTMIGARDQIYNRLRELDGIAWPEPAEKSMQQASLYLAKLALNSLGDLFSSAKNIMDWLGELAHLVAKQNQPMSWMTPLGLPVVQPYRQAAKYQVKTHRHTITMTDNSDLLPVSSNRQKSAFPPNFVHSLDATHMFMTCLDCKKRGLTFSSVHDSYWTHAGTMEEMNSSLREQFIKLYSQPILEELRESLAMRFPQIEFPPVPERGELDLALVRHSKYFFA